jgi:hypothetical protein
MRRYNSVYTLSFEVNHSKEDGGDVSLRDLRTAINKKIDEACAEGNPFPVFEGPLDTQQVYPFDEGDKYYSVYWDENAKEWRLDCSVWDDVSKDDHDNKKARPFVYLNSCEKAVTQLVKCMLDDIEWSFNRNKAAGWVVCHMQTQGFKYPTEVGDSVTAEQVYPSINAWMNR